MIAPLSVDSFTKPLCTLERNQSTTGLDPAARAEFSTGNKIALDKIIRNDTLSSVSKRTVEIGKAIKDFRLEREMTQVSMAAYLGISRPTIIRLEAGRGIVSDLLYSKVKRKLDKALANQAVA